MPSIKWGESPLAVVVRADPDLDEAAVLAHCSDKLARFKLPKRAVFADVIRARRPARHSNACCANSFRSTPPHIQGAARETTHRPRRLVPLYGDAHDLRPRHRSDDLRTTQPRLRPVCGGV